MATNYDENKLTKLGALKQLAERINENFTPLDDFNEVSEKVDELDTDVTTLQDKVGTLEEANGEENKIEVIKVNGSVQSITSEEKSVNITVPTTVEELSDSSNYATVAEVNSKISSVYKPAGSIEFDSLTTASADNLGFVYNVTNAFTTNDKFVDGEQGHSYPAGTNVVVVDVGDGDPDYKYDVLAGFVDLTDYAKLEDIVTYKDATNSNSGLMSATDKQKLDGIKIASDDEVNNMLNDVFED